MLTIFVDADACPVKEEVYRVATRYALPVWVVANGYIRTPDAASVTLVTVEAGDDVADDWIAERVASGDVVVTADIPLAARCLDSGARVVDHKGSEFTEDSIGSALAGRELSKHLREMGIETRGPAPMSKKDRGRFLGTLDSVIQAIRRSANA